MQINRFQILLVITYYHYYAIIDRYDECNNMFTQSTQTLILSLRHFTRLRCALDVIKL